MQKTKFIILKIKSLIIPSCICLFTTMLIVFSNANFESCKYGIKLWANSVVPSLLPFFIATELLNYTNFVYLLGKVFDKIMRPIFNVPGNSTFPLIMGIISGYPVGAKIVSNLKLQGSLSNEEAERLLAFTNNSGPLFIVGTVGIGLFKNIQVGIILLITHVLASLTIGFLFRWWKPSCNNFCNKKREKVAKPLFPSSQISAKNLGEILSKSIMNAINTVLLIGGFIVLFSVIISMLESSKVLSILSNILAPFLHACNIPPYFSTGIISGIVELTHGLSKIALISTGNLSITICAFILGFGGISVCLQILSIISKAEISIKPYIIGKLLQGFLAAVYTYLIINFIPFFSQIQSIL